jgi:bifunctional N-acetylglucosamine-1-phosphate-uridyltransferase/glucosamine-1-phosphate-acetyltransferase GlmU-like protein
LFSYAIKYDILITGGKTMSFELETLKEKILSKDNLTYLILKNDEQCVVKDIPSHKMDICGKQILDWTLNACEKSSKIIQATYSMQDNIFDIVRKNIKTAGVVCVLYADSPLLSTLVLQEIWNQFISSGEKICRLPRGFILETEVLNSGINSLGIKRIGEMYVKEFLSINNLFAYSEAQKIMQQKIIAYHLNNGVIFKDTSSVFVDADAEIGEASIVFPNNSLFGSTKIGKNCILLPNNVIINSSVGDMCELKGAYVEDSKIADGKMILPFTTIIKDKTIN